MPCLLFLEFSTVRGVRTRQPVGPPRLRVRAHARPLVARSFPWNSSGFLFVAPTKRERPSILECNNTTRIFARGFYCRERNGGGVAAAGIAPITLALAHSLIFMHRERRPRRSDSSRLLGHLVHDAFRLFFMCLAAHTASSIGALRASPEKSVCK